MLVGVGFKRVFPFAHFRVERHAEIPVFTGIEIVIRRHIS